MESLPSETILRVFEFLTPKGVLNCSCVCQQWLELAEDNLLWKRLFTLENFATTLRADVLSELVKQSSWKAAFVCCHILTKKSSPYFWNDFNLLLRISQRQPIVPMKVTLCPLNGLFWMLLQLKLESPGFLSPLTCSGSKLESKEQTNTLLQKWVLTLCHCFGSEIFLKKLLEVVDMPSARCFPCRGEHHKQQSLHITSLLLVQLSQCCVPIGEFSPSARHSIPTFILHGSDWERQFVGPVQDSVIKALQFWMTAVGCKEVECLAGHQDRKSSSLLQVWRKLTMGSFWVDKRRTTVDGLVKTLHKRESATKAKFMLQELDFIVDRDIPPTEAAMKLSSWSFLHLHRVPQLDLLGYLMADNSEVCSNPLNRLVHTYCSELAETVTRFCTSVTHTKKEKVAAIHHTIEVCVHLQEMKDFTSLKALLSSVRTTVGQSHRSHLSWNDVSMKHCRCFKRLEELMSHPQCYRTYFRHIHKLKEPYVPYLPAHRQYVRLNLLRPGPHSSQGTELDLLTTVPYQCCNLIASRSVSMDRCCIHSTRVLCMYSRLKYLYMLKRHCHFYCTDLRSIGAVVDHILSL